MDELLPQQVEERGSKDGQEEDRVTGKKLRELAISQGWKCALSGSVLTTENCELDHIVPYSKGGEHLMSNVHLVTRRVNRMKGTMGMERFIDACLSVAKHMNGREAIGSPSGV